MMAAMILAAAQALSAEAAAAMQDATDRTLAGETLPPGHLLELAHLPPAERLLVVVHLRRLGLLEGPAHDIERLIAPPAAAPAANAAGGYAP